MCIHAVHRLEIILLLVVIILSKVGSLETQLRFEGLEPLSFCTPFLLVDRERSRVQFYAQLFFSTPQSKGWLIYRPNAKRKYMFRSTCIHSFKQSSFSTSPFSLSFYTITTSFDSLCNRDHCKS